MTKTNDILCSANSCPSGDNLPTGSYDINSPAFYQCGTICNTSSGTFEYNFKGIKFGIIGTKTPDHHSFKVDIDGTITEISTYKVTREEYSTFYVSKGLEYKDHNIKIIGNNELIELYKLVYWPHLQAKRLNATDFAEQIGTWKTQSDNVRGLRHYVTQDSTTDSIKSVIPFSKVWIYGSKCSWCNHYHK